MRCEVHVLEMDDEPVADLGTDERSRDEVLVAGHRRVGQRPPPAARVAAIDGRRHDGLRRVQLRAGDVVAPVGRHVPHHRRGRDPELANGRGGTGDRRGSERCHAGRQQRRQSGRRTTHWTVIVAFMNGWMRQTYGYVPGSANVTLPYSGSGLGGTSSRAPEFQNPSPCSAGDSAAGGATRLLARVHRPRVGDRLLERSRERAQEGGLVIDVARPERRGVLLGRARRHEEPHGRARRDGEILREEPEVADALSAFGPHADAVRRHRGVRYERPGDLQRGGDLLLDAGRDRLRRRHRPGLRAHLDVPSMPGCRLQ